MERLNATSQEKIKDIVLHYKNHLGPIKLMLHDVQHELGYIPFEAMEMIANATGSSVADVYGVVTFYTQFTTAPKGKHIINVCMGTACYVNGAQTIVDELIQLTGAKVNSTSSDGLFSLDATRCLGACGLAPVVIVDGKVYGSETAGKVVAGIVKEITKTERLV
ncbi:MAG: NAD(P)H-dependent oxidoreductase subunit E [Anaerorhabdus sp.]